MDSEKYHHLAWQRIANILGVDFTYEEYAPFKSAGRQKVIPYLLTKSGKTATEQDIEYYSAIRQQCAATALARVSDKDIIPGVLQFIAQIKTLGIKCAVASASTSSLSVATRLKIADLFDVFVDGTAGLPHKPQPDIFLFTAHKTGVKPSQCIVFEDSANGIQAALNAGMYCIGIQTYFTDAVPAIKDFTNVSFQRIEELCTTKFQRKIQNTDV